MSRFLSILKIILSYRAALFPAVVGVVAAVAAIMGRKLDIGKLQALVDATGTLATVLSSVVGAVMDASNANVKKALTTQGDAINFNANLADPRTDTNPLITPPRYVPSPPVPAVDPESREPK